MIEFGRNQSIKATDKDRKTERMFANFLVENAMIEQGGLSFEQLREVLAGEYPIYLETFETEIEKLVEEGLLIRKAPLIEIIHGGKKVETVLLGNGEKEFDPQMTWLDPSKPEIEERPDLVIIGLSKQGKFHSIRIED